MPLLGNTTIRSGDPVSVVGSSVPDTLFASGGVAAFVRGMIRFRMCGETGVDRAAFRLSLESTSIMPQPSIPLRNPKTAAFLAWLVPGLGHIYQGRVGKGILYAVCILSLYGLGFAMGEGKIVYWRWVNPLNNPERFCLYYLGQFFVGLPALPALIQGTLKWLGMNEILWGFMAEPAQNVLNGLHPRLGKLVEIGSMYTAVAGLLNVLAIYDAYEGPAFTAAESESDPKPATAAEIAPVAS